MTSLILQTAARALFHTIVVFSLFLLFAGHNNPGGGFIGGLVAATALVLRYNAGGAADTRRVVRVGPEQLLGAGGLLAVVAGIAGVVAGGSFLENVALELDGLPVFGHVEVTSVLAFDIGVYLIVVGVVYAILDALGDEMDPSPSGGAQARGSEESDPRSAEPGWRSPSGGAQARGSEE